EALALKDKVAATRQEMARVNQQLQDIVKDQERLRANLKEMPPTAEAYKRYLKKFDDQESDIEKLQAHIKVLRDTGAQQQQALDAFLGEMTVEGSLLRAPSTGPPLDDSGGPRLIAD